MMPLLSPLSVILRQNGLEPNVLCKKRGITHVVAFGPTIVTQPLPYLGGTPGGIGALTNWIGKNDDDDDDDDDVGWWSNS